MKIIGWIRYGDKTACGGTVVEGDQTCTSYGRAYAFQGARIACRKNCVIVEGFIRSTLTNGRAQVIHGMTTSGGCPCYSTLNDIDGVGNEGGETIAEKHFLNADGYWAPVKDPEPHEDPYDEQPKLVAPPIEGVPYYVETMDGRTFSGRTGADGLHLASFFEPMAAHTRRFPQQQIFLRPLIQRLHAHQVATDQTNRQTIQVREQVSQPQQHFRSYRQANAEFFS